MKEKVFNQFYVKSFVRNICKVIIDHEKIVCHTPKYSDTKNPREFVLVKPTSFVTTPLFYTNDRPHLGHIYSTLLADAKFRLEFMLNPTDKFILLTGTDEHGDKIAKASRNKVGDITKTSTLDYCNKISDEFKQLFSKSGIFFNRFVRTTSSRHKEVVYWLWHRIYSRGFIYPGFYQGWYDLVNEEFVPPSEAIVDIKYVKNAEHHHDYNPLNSSYDASLRKCGIRESNNAPVNWVKEPNYMLSLSKLQPQILKWLSLNEANESPILPEWFTPIALNYLEEIGHRDISVSRFKTENSWGIPVPNDSTQTIYVWFDALAGYLTASGLNPKHHSITKDEDTDTFIWPPTHQFVGKDILKFHCVIWPALLIAAGLDLPRKIICHSHWLQGHQKMSKSVGNVVDPFEVVNTTFGGSFEGLRYALLRGGSELNQDSNYDAKRLKDLVNAELAHTLGNLVNRATSLINLSGDRVQISLNHYSKLPNVPDDVIPCLEKVRERSKEMIERYLESCKAYRFDRALQTVMEYLKQTNMTYEQIKPWNHLTPSSILPPEHMVTKETPSNTNLPPSLPILPREMVELFITTHNSLRLCGILLQPFVPGMARKLLSRIGITQNKYTFDCIEYLDVIDQQPSPLHSLKQLFQTPWDNVYQWYTLNNFATGRHSLVFDRRDSFMSDELEETKNDQINSDYIQNPNTTRLFYPRI